MNLLRWLGRNLTSLILSLLLAIVIWTSAVTSANPNIETELTIPLEVIQPATDIAIVDPLPETVTIKILAPESIILQLEEDDSLTANINLTDIEAGTYRFPVQLSIPDQLKPIRILEQNPTQLELKVSNLISKSLSISIQIEGEPAIGYKTGGLEWDQVLATVTGQETRVNQIATVVGILDISDARETISTELKLEGYCPCEPGNQLTGWIQKCSCKCNHCGNRRTGLPFYQHHPGATHGNGFFRRPTVG